MATAQTATHPLPFGQRMIVTVGVMTAVLLQVLDTTIANVALPHMLPLEATEHPMNFLSKLDVPSIAVPRSPRKTSAKRETAEICRERAAVDLLASVSMLNANQRMRPAPVVSTY